MNWRTDARIWGLVGFGFGAVLASGGSLRSPLDALFGGLIQAGIWFLIARIIIKRSQRAVSRDTETRSEEISEKKTILLFDKPVTRDWLFYVFLVFLVANVVNGLSNVYESGGISTSTAGIITGLIDGAFRIILAYFPIIPIIYLVRKLIRKQRKV